MLDEYVLIDMEDYNTDEEYMTALINANGLLATEGLYDAIKEDVTGFGKRLVKKSVSLFSNPDEKHEQLENYAQETIKWLQEQDKDYKNLDLQTGYYFLWLKTKKFRWWKFYYILDDNAYNDLLNAIDDDKDIKTKQWINKYTTGALRGIIAAETFVIESLLGIATRAYHNKWLTNTRQDPNKRILDKHTGEVVSEANALTRREDVQKFSEDFQAMLDKLIEWRVDSNTIIRKDKDNLKKLFNDLVDAKTIKDLIVIVEEYRSRVNMIFERIDKVKRKEKHFPFQLLMLGLADLEATVKHLVKLSVRMKDYDE